MLPHYSPLKVVENFSMLSSLFPGRIDLGIGRAPGTSAQIAFALQRDRRQPAPDDFRQQLDELLGYTHKGPPVYLLGSSPQSAVWAAELGVPYVFADFINPGGSPLAAHYREHFRPVSHGSPTANLSGRVGVVRRHGRGSAADFIQRAHDVAESVPRTIGPGALGRESYGVSRQRRRSGGICSRRPQDHHRSSPEHVRQSIEDVAAEYGADEVFVVNIVHDPAARIRCYELIAQAFRLTTSQTSSI